MIVGISVGAFAAVVLVIGLAVFIYFKFFRRQGYQEIQ